MKKVGLVGGVAWRSTVEYYAEICRRNEELNASMGEQDRLSTLEMVIESLDLKTAISYLGREGDEISWEQFDGYHNQALRRLEASGAQVAAIASNTPHHRFEMITRGITIPVINLFDVVAQEGARRGIGHVLILGTVHTMRSSVFRHTFARYGIEADCPGDESTFSEITLLLSWLQSGRKHDAARNIERLGLCSYEARFSGRPTVCLACTELSLAFPEYKDRGLFEAGSIRYLNTTALHVDAILKASSSA
jgi:aspartate racemase